MTFHILTLFPEIFEGYSGASILARAVEQKRVNLDLVNIRDFAVDKHRSCDDATYGGGPGMILKPEPLAAALESIPGVKAKSGAAKARRRGRTRVIYLSAAGRLWSQELARELARERRVALICGRYEGVDQRVIDLFVDDEISIGDYVLNGGEVAAMVIVDSVVRLLKGVIKQGSLAEESFAGGLLEYPQYTRPAVFRGLEVPEVLLSGNHAQIERWRRERSMEKTRRYRPELVENDLQGRDEEIQRERDTRRER